MHLSTGIAEFRRDSSFRLTDLRYLTFKRRSRDLVQKIVLITQLFALSLVCGDHWQDCSSTEGTTDIVRRGQPARLAGL